MSLRADLARQRSEEEIADNRNRNNRYNHAVKGKLFRTASEKESSAAAAALSASDASEYFKSLQWTSLAHVLLDSEDVSRDAVLAFVQTLHCEESVLFFLEERVRLQLVSHSLSFLLQNHFFSLSLFLFPLSLSLFLFLSLSLSFSFFLFLFLSFFLSFSFFLSLSFFLFLSLSHSITLFLPQSDWPKRTIPSPWFKMPI